MRLAFLLATVALSGCNLLGDDTEALAARREADGKAIGGACRHAGRAIEDCYTLNRKADKAAVYAGWREMNDYMRENKIDPVLPQLGGDTAVAHAAEGGADAKKAGKAADKAGEKVTPKAGGAKAADRAADKGPDKSNDKATDKPADKPSDKATDKPPAKDSHSSLGPEAAPAS